MNRPALSIEEQQLSAHCEIRTRETGLEDRHVAATSNAHSAHRRHRTDTRSDFKFDASTVGLDELGAVGEIRTHTEGLLRPLPPTFGLRRRLFSERY